MYKYMSIIPSANRKGPLFNGRRFSPLSLANVTTTLRQLLHGTDEEPVNHASHSFRIGAATTVAAAGLPPALIKTLGRWKSNAYESYVQYPPSSLNAVSSLLAHTDASNQKFVMITLLELKEQPLIAIISLSVRIVIL